MHKSVQTKAASLHFCECGWLGGKFWGLPGCCRGDQRPQATSDPGTHGASQEEAFEGRGYGCALTQVQELLTMDRQ